MRWINQPIKIAGMILIGIGTILLALNIFFGRSLNVALPLVFMMLGGMFFVLAAAAGQKLAWASILNIPGSLLLVLGLIILLNILTQDWNSWAYAWLLLVAGLGAGLVLANRRQSWPPVVNLAGWGMVAVGVTLFALFGIIAGGLFIQVMAPIFLILGGLALHWLHPGPLLTEPLRKRFHLSQREETPESTAEQDSLIEPLSTRELEVLRLVDQGLSNQQIALKLSIAPSTVKTHINNIYGKLGVQTRVQAINRARELGLLDL